MAGFEEDPRDNIESYSCGNCSEGSITFNNIKNCWECDSCDWSPPNSQEADII